MHTFILVSNLPCSHLTRPQAAIVRETLIFRKQKLSQICHKRRLPFSGRVVRSADEHAAARRASLGTAEKWHASTGCWSQFLTFFWFN
jgi:hypothetical protein